MKLKTSVALGQETLISIRELIRKGQFRNKSHVMEFAIQKLIKEVQDEG